jgi:PAS domain-containing protein
MLELFEKLLSLVGSLPWKDLSSAVGKLFAQQKLVLMLALAFLALAVGSVVHYWNRGSRLESIVNDSLQASLEETPQQHKGLEAFLMTSLNEQVRKISAKPLVGYVKSAELSPAFMDRYAQFLNKLSTAGQIDCPGPELTVAEGDGSEIVLTDSSTLGFLFAPLRLFRSSPDASGLYALGDSRNTKKDTTAAFINRALQEDPFLKKDICVSAAVAPEIHQFTEIYILDRGSIKPEVAQFLDIAPRQTYLISRSGLNRIFLRSTKATRKYYATQFRATTFFPSRPYFWPAFDPNFVVTTATQSLTTAPRVDSFFAVTQPYMDLGGNGIVITLSKGFRLPGLSEFALCFDLAFEADAGLQGSLKKSVERFDGQMTEVTCSLNDNSSTCQPNHPGRQETGDESDLREALTKSLRDAVKDGQQDKVFGNILVLPPLRASEREDRVLASIPVGKVRIDGQDKSADFLVVEFNFFKYRRVTTIWAVVAATCSFVSLTILGFTLTRTVLQSREFDNALRRITFVMEEAPTAFVWLDATDHVSEANQAFWTLIGRRREEKFTLRSIISKESVGQYDAVQENRELGKNVEPYRLTLIRGDGSTVDVHIRSMDVPKLNPERGVLPETFGVFLTPA